jgi:hypothetical protein
MSPAVLLERGGAGALARALISAHVLYLHHFLRPLLLRLVASLTVLLCSSKRLGPNLKVVTGVCLPFAYLLFFVLTRE